MTTPVTVMDGGVVATMDGVRAEHAPGHLVVRDGLVEAVGPGPAPAFDPAMPVDRVDARGCLVTPGLVNTHHHLYQWATRGLCVDDGLFGWLTSSVSSCTPIFLPHVGSNACSASINAAIPSPR